MGVSQHFRLLSRLCAYRSPFSVGERGLARSHYLPLHLGCLAVEAGRVVRQYRYDLSGVLAVDVPLEVLEGALAMGQTPLRILVSSFVRFLASA